MKYKISRQLGTCCRKLVPAFAAGCICFCTGARAQSVDALLDKLVTKGVITASEAEELRKDQSTTSATIKNKIQTASWVESIKLSGEFGVRADHVTVDNDQYVDRFRPRYRIRVGTTAALLDNLSAELRLASGDAGRSPLASGYTTFEDNAAKKHIWIDRAYGKWCPIKGDSYVAGLVVGKMVNPFNTTWLVFDADYSPEGVAAVGSLAVTPDHRLGFSAGAFMLDELADSSRDPYLVGAQLVWNATWTTNLLSELKIGVFGLGNSDRLDNATVPNLNVGNTRTAGGALAYNFNPVVLGASVTYLLGTTSLYPGRLPVTFDAEFIHNPAVSAANQAWIIGAALGRTAKKGTWSLEYHYYRIESDAWFEEFINDDSLAFYSATPPGSGKTTGVYGGTNQKGHLLCISYAVTDSLSLAARSYINRLIEPPTGARNDTAYHIQVDAVLKF